MIVLLATALLLTVELSVDYARCSAPSWHLQELADSAAPAMAASIEKDPANLKRSRGMSSKQITATTG